MTTKRKLGGAKQRGNKGVRRIYPISSGESVAFIADLERSLLQETSEWIGSGEREWDKIDLRFRTTGSAKVSRNAIKKRYVISIGKPFISRLHSIITKLTSSNALELAKWEVREGNSWKGFGEDMKDLHSRNSPVGEIANNQAWLADFLTRSAVRFIYYHELAHVVRGHVYHAARKAKRINHCFSYDEDSAGDKRVPLNHVRFFEVDADRVGVDFFVRLTVFSYWLKEARPLRRKFAVLLAFAVGVALMILDLPKNRKQDRPVIHEHPFIRWLLVIDVLGGAVGREMKLGSENLRRMTHAAVAFLKKAASALGLRSSSWKVTSKSAWRKALARQESVLRRAARLEKLLFRDRSTLIPAGY